MTLYQTFDQTEWLALKEQAILSSRRRAHFNLHHTYDESVQKTLICLLKGTYIPPHFHRHSHQKELFIVLEGRVKVIFFDRLGSIVEVLYLGDGESGSIIEILPDVIHTVVCITDYAFVLEVKQGPFVLDDCKEFLDWTIPEKDALSSRYVQWLEKANIKQNFKFLHDRLAG